MKKIIAAFILIITLSFSFGCTKYSASRFNDLKFDDELTAKEKNDLLEKLEDSFISFSKVTISMESFEKYGQIDNKETAELSFKAYNNFLVVGEGKHTKDVDDNGIRYNKKSTIEMDAWANDESNKVIMFYATDGDEDYSELMSYTNENASTRKNEAYLFLLDRLEDLVDEDFEDLNGYKLKGGGYALAISNKNEAYNATTWGTETRERYTLNETQIVVIIDKDYRITEITMYSSSSTNRDPDTGEWYSSTKKISGTSVTIKVSYGSRKDDTSKVSSLNSGYKEDQNKQADE